MLNDFPEISELYGPIKCALRQKEEKRAIILTRRFYWRCLAPPGSWLGIVLLFRAAIP